MEPKPKRPASAEEDELPAVTRFREYLRIRSVQPDPDYGMIWRRHTTFGGGGRIARFSRVGEEVITTVPEAVTSHCLSLPWQMRQNKKIIMMCLGLDGALCLDTNRCFFYFPCQHKFRKTNRSRRGEGTKAFK